ncbi:MAG: hypothetical protein NC452_06505 [Eubacterium sp.]|nr:hypothetical protein [Eubacterium sp.]
MKINDNMTIWDDTKRVGEITKDGYVYDDKDNYLGQIDGDGKIYGNDEYRLGSIDEKSGKIYNQNGIRMGAIDKNGNVTDDNGRSASGIPLLSNQTPAANWLDDLGPFVKFILVLLLGLGFLTVAIYCWLQLLISAVVSVFVIRALCKKAFLNKKEPYGIFPITFVIVYIPTLIITLCQSWGDKKLEMIICIVGGILVGLLLTYIVSKAVTAICRKVYYNKN